MDYKNTPSTSEQFIKLELFNNIYQRIHLDSDITIGREEDNKLILSDLSSSSHHAIIAGDKDGVWVEDLGSTNGTLVNDIIVHKKYLKPGDIITIGYTKIIFNKIEKLKIIVDLSQENEIDEKKYLQSNNILFIIFKHAQIDILLEILEKKLNCIFPPDVNLEEFLIAIKEGLYNAYTHGNSNQEKEIQCHLFQDSLNVTITIKDNGKGFNYVETLQNLLKAGNMEKRGLLSLINSCNYLEYNETGNQVTLVKRLLQNTNKIKTDAFKFNEYNMKRNNDGQKKYLTVRYFSKMACNTPFPLKIFISEKEIKGFPEHVENKTMINHANPSSNLFEVIPVYPGCIVSPAHRNIDLNNTSAKLEFWITPLSKACKMSQAKLEFIKGGKNYHNLRLPYSIFNNYIPKLFLFAAFLIPLLCIIIDIPQIELNQELPIIVTSMISIIRLFGGVTNCGILAGLLLLSFGVTFYIKHQVRITEISNDQFDI